jgi:hypothetical protein
MKRKFSILTLVVMSGCMSSHYDRTENFQFLWKIGDLDRAEEEAARLA